MFIAYLFFNTNILGDFHFNEMSDGILKESFRILQASKNCS